MIANVVNMVRSLAQLEPLADAPNLPSAILEATLGPRRVKSSWRAWFGWLRPFSQPRFAYGAVSVMVTIIVISRSEEHTSELQSHLNLVCRLLLEKKKRRTMITY